MSTNASLFIDDMPEVGEGVQRFTIDCKWSETRLFFRPGSDLDIEESALISLVLMRHEQGCGRCNTARLGERRGDVGLRAMTEDAMRQLEAVALKERRN